MRIIAGKYRGKRLTPPSGDRVRPTTDRVKETVFNILGSRGFPAGKRVLDLFGGSGALGIEALSRGAEKVVFCDNHPDSIRLIEKNLTGIDGDRSVYKADYRTAIEKLAGQKFDLVLLDPPYAMDVVPEILSLLEKNDILLPGAIIFVEQNSANNLINLPESYIIDTRRCGNTDISFITKNPKERRQQC